MKKHAITDIEFPGADINWNFEVEEDCEFFLVTFKEYEYNKRKYCSEQLFSREDLIKLRDTINHFLK